MKSYAIKNIVLGLYDQFIDYKDNFKRNEGGYFVVKIDGDNFGYENNGNIYHLEWEKRIIKYYHIIILSSRMVFTCLSDDDKMPNFIEWKNTSNHDSCFRSGFDEMTVIGFNIWDKIYKNTPDKHKPATKDDSINFTLSHGWLFGPVFKCVSVDYKPISYEDSYHKNLIRIDLIEKQITVKI